MQAIHTKILQPTNRAGTRVLARCAAGYVVVPYDHELGEVQDQHKAAAEALVRKLRATHGNEAWGLDWAGGCLPNGDYCWVSLRHGVELRVYKEN